MRNEDQLRRAWVCSYLKETDEKLQDPMLKKGKLREGLWEMNHDLKKTIRSWEKFEQSGIKYFRDNYGQPEYAVRMMSAIDEIKEVYSNLKLTLEDMEDLYNEVCLSSPSKFPYWCVHTSNLDQVIKSQKAERDRVSLVHLKQDLELALTQTENSTTRNILASRSASMYEQMLTMSEKVLDLAHTQEKATKVIHRLTYASMVSLGKGGSGEGFLSGFCTSLKLTLWYSVSCRSCWPSVVSA